MTTAAVLVFLIALIIGTVSMGIYRFVLYRAKTREHRFWRRWLRRGQSFTQEDLLAFGRRFPQKCAVCSMVRFAYQSGLDYVRLQQSHRCPEQSHRRARQ